MLLFGGIVGFLAAFFLFVGPAAVSLAAAVGTSTVWPFQVFSPVFAIGFAGGLIVQLLVVLLLYALAAIVTPAVQGRVTTNLFEEWCRGALIGINACANFLYAAALYPAIGFLLGAQPGLALALVLAPFYATALGVINFLCVFPGLTRNFAFEATLGWSSWFMPMGWPLHLLGFIVFLIGLIASWFGRPFAALGDWWPGNIARHGWLFNFGRAAFTLGNFTTVSASLRRATPAIVGTGTNVGVGFGTALGIVSHEVGHSMVVAAFGTLFTIVGYIHERIVSLISPAGGGHAYFEFLCEGIRRVSGDSSTPADSNPWIPMWAPPVTLAGTSGANALPLVDATIDGVAVDAGVVVPLTVGTAVDLDASGCSDPDDFPMGNISPGNIPSVRVRWRVTTRPTGSAAAIANATSLTTTFTADVAGAYQITFAVTDGAEGEVHTVDLTAV